MNASMKEAEGGNAVSDLEKLLIKKSKTGDIESFELLVSSYDRKAYNIAYRMMGNEEDAKDMAQEAMLRVYRSIKDFKEQSSFSTWLYRIVTNVCLDELRKRKKERTVSLDSTIKRRAGKCGWRYAPTERRRRMHMRGRSKERLLLMP
jgi:RNA polymerase sigma-70 factor (ECF subfamily)